MSTQDNGQQISGAPIARATQRPAPFAKPAHWTNDPVPTAAPATATDAEDPAGLSPTRYGDWVNKGIAVDF